MAMALALALILTLQAQEGMRGRGATHHEPRPGREHGTTRQHQRVVRLQYDEQPPRAHPARAALFDVQFSLQPL